MHGHVQPVAVGLDVRVGHRPRDGLPRLEPGPAGLRPHGPGPGPRADPRHRRDASCPRGGAYHQYQPFTKRGNDAVGSGFNDDPAVARPRRRRLPQGDRRHGHPRRAPCRTTTRPGSETPLYEHLQRAFRYTLDRLGPHGLPLIGRADWNDCLNLNCFSETPGESFQTTENKAGGVAESVFIAGLFVLAADEMAAIAERRGEPREAEPLPRRGGPDDGGGRRRTAGTGPGSGARTTTSGTSSARRRTTRARSSSSRRGCASWPAIGLDDGRADQALASVRARLATPHGIVLQQPAYSGYRLNLGEITSYPPGYKENAGIFCHTNPWLMIAEAMAGNGDGALDYYLRINPSAREAISEIHRCEPYVYAQMIAGPRRADPRRGEELVADRHGRLELRRGQPVDRGDPARARRPAHRSVPAGRRGATSRRPAASAARPTGSSSTRPSASSAGSAGSRSTAGLSSATSCPCPLATRAVTIEVEAFVEASADAVAGARGRAPDPGDPGVTARSPRPRRAVPSDGEYHGRPTRRLDGDRLWVEVLATAGPRIVRLGLAGSGDNLLAETPDIGWETPTGRYELFGGHRLWFAPEDPDRGRRARHGRSRPRGRAGRPPADRRPPSR